MKHIDDAPEIRHFILKDASGDGEQSKEHLFDVLWSILQPRQV